MQDDPRGPISREMRQCILNSSWIRQMFEEGNKLKARYGADRVFDFSLGNPSAPPPPEFHEALVRVATESAAADHRYMTNTGLESTRRWVAERAAADHGGPFGPEHVVMTCGAAGALNIVLRSILDPGDEVILLAPYFPEYLWYVRNNGGRVVTVPTDADFQPDLAAIDAAIGPRTRAIVVNSPNNPTGVVYLEERIEALGRLVEERSEERGDPIYLLADEPYRRIVYTDRPLGSVIRSCRHGIVCTSFSKDLGLAGERIGYVLLNPEDPGREVLFSALAIATRTLGFVNAPAFMQRILPLCGDAQVDLTDYRTNRDLMLQGMREAGYRIPEPEGAFFLFPEAPGGDDVEFCALLRKRRVLCVPGRGFGTEGHVRISYAVPRASIEAALPIFAEAISEAGTGRVESSRP